MLIVVAGLLGFVSVALGAYADHGLRESLDEESLRSIMTGIRYHQIHAVAALAAGFALRARIGGAGARWIAIGGWGFVLGLVMFSGAIYLNRLFGVGGLSFLAPVGGSTLMLAWLSIALAGLLSRRA